MPEHSETTPTRYTNQSTVSCTPQVSAGNGRVIVAECAVNLPQRLGTMIEITTMYPDSLAAWRALVTKDATL